MRTITKKLAPYFLISFILFLSLDVQCQEKLYNHSALISPGSVFLGRLNLRYERLRESHLTYGSRLEVSFVDKTFDKHLWLIPYGRYYFFNEEHNGLYSEVGLGYRIRYAKSKEWTASDDWFKSAAVLRLYLGAQFNVGKKSRTPLDVGLGINYDFQNGKIPAEVNTGTVLVGPLSVFSFRIQTGLCF